MQEIPADIRAKIQRKLNAAAKQMEEALDLAREHGWPDAIGFVEGGGSVNVIRSIEDREARAGADKEWRIYSRAPMWDCGAW